jgi:crossover junction endodeoxyribonuclease RusA
MDIDLPFEFAVPGVPVSQQSKASSITAWKSIVQRAALVERRAEAFTTAQPVTVTMFFVFKEPMAGDLDNIIKPILDALNGVIYIDDQQVERITIERSAELSTPANMATQTAAQILRDLEPPYLYVRVDHYDERSQT